MNEQRKQIQGEKFELSSNTHKPKNKKGKVITMANKVLITNKQEDFKIPSGTRLLIRRCCNAVLLNEGFNHPTEIGVTFVDNNEIKELNSKHRNKDSVTDVLSFPQFENIQDVTTDTDKGVVHLGDIVLSVEKAAEQAKEYNHSFQREIAYLTVHSMLHLLGYHHEDGGLQEVHMREKEEEVLKKLGLQRGFSYTE